MDSDLHPPSDSPGAKAAFHKPSNDPSNRKYRRRSPVTGSSSSDGEPVRERSSTPTHRKDERRDVDRDHYRSRYSRDGGSNRNTDRRSYNDRRHDVYKKREKYAEDDHKNFHKLSPHTRGGSDHSRREFEQNRSRDNVDKHSREGSGHRSSRDKHKKDDVRDEKRYGHHHKDSSWRDSKELDDSKYTRFEKGKSYDQEIRGVKDRYFKEPRQPLDDESIVPAKKSKFSMGKDTEYTNFKLVTVANEVQSSSSKQGQEFVGKANTEQDFVKDSDIDAAKVAAMKAAELVNRNLIGTGIMSTDQKKKLLWGSKKSTPTEEAAHRWDTSMFSDRERQEKFNKLMSLRLVWPIVGCERGSEGRAESRDPRQQSCREAERASDRLGEAVHRWASSKGWSYCRFRSLITISCWYLLYLSSARTKFLLFDAFVNNGYCVLMTLVSSIMITFGLGKPVVDVTTVF
ncbi:hypothetical protein SSX86_024716 [Deinandra increscens subsp. villosa]|uniref:Arginine/serine-rich coiled-coil protein 2 n=1 Tax=Deinandra increscens subsp. villosa TaxID=3103831 RepID=A0AAP0CGE1_9ASTR